MSPWRLARRLGAGVLAVVALGLSGCGEEKAEPNPAPGQVTFSILSAQGQASAGPLWQPLLDDMSRSIGVPVKPHFASTYADLIADMKRGGVQAAWFSARPAIEAIDTADAEVIARIIAPNGQDTYRSTLIVRRDSGITLDDVLACGKRYSFGLGDARSTTGALAPMTFLFNPRGIDPQACFRTTRSANHERNAFEVASGVVDVATSNSATRVNLARQNPAVAGEIVEIWQSPPIPEGGILVREDLDPVLKEKIRSFFLTYGQGESIEADRQRRVLASLNYARFNAADDGYLDPVREMIADQTLTAARARGDAAAASKAQRELRRLRARREVQP